MNNNIIYTARQHYFNILKAQFISKYPLRHKSSVIEIYNLMVIN